MGLSNKDISASEIGGKRQLKKEIAKLKQELKQKDKLLQDKNEELQKYLYTMTHELKTPIVSIRGYSMLLENFHKTALNDEVLEYLDRISVNIERLEDLIDELLEFARIELKSEDLESVEIKRIIEKSITDLRYLSEENGTEIRLQHDFPTVFCNTTLILRVFTNLLSNAIKYSHKDRNKYIEIGYQDDEIFHKFYVKDNGIGIPKKKQDQLFKLFSRIHADKEIAGSGLGLAITKRIINQHGGEIWVESAKGKGTIFYFTLPRK
ncbi:GHKL domain-containing protein [candidate division KSB1 bacterium]|nr:GHKL domain-containing protein [candidate division KSB1 bacterium]